MAKRLTDPIPGYESDLYTFDNLPASSIFASDASIGSILERYYDGLNGLQGDRAYDILTDYLNWRQTQEQRDFDTQWRDNERAWQSQWRDNERAYDSASAQVARLMQTGLSRDAALQLLGSAGGSGTAAATAGASGISPVPATVNSSLSNTAAAISGSLQNLGQSVLAAAELGVSAPASLSLANLQQIDAQVAQAQFNSISAIGQFDALVSDARLNGVEFNSQYSTPDEFIAECANSSYKPLSDFVKSGGFTRIKSMPFGSQNFNSWFSDNIKTRSESDKAAYLANQVRLADAQTRFTETSIDEHCILMGEHIEETKKIIQDRLNSVEITRASLKKTDAEIGLIGAQAEASRSHSNYLTELATGQHYENALIHPTVNAVINLDDVLTQYNIDKLNAEMYLWRSTAGNKKVLRSMVTDFFAQKENQSLFLAAVLADTKELRAFQQDPSALGGKAHNFYGFTQWLKNSGVGEVADDVLGEVGSAFTIYYLMKGRNSFNSPKPYNAPRTTFTGGSQTTYPQF